MVGAALLMRYIPHSCNFFENRRSVVSICDLDHSARQPWLTVSACSQPPVRSPWAKSCGWWTRRRRRRSRRPFGGGCYISPDNSVAQLFGHLLCVRLTQVQLVSDLPVRQVEAHEVEAEHPNPQRLMTSSQNGAGQIIKTRLTIRASIPLAMRLSLIVTIPSHRGTVAMGTADAGRPAMLANQLVTFGIVDQRRQSNQRHHGTTLLLVATPSLNQPRHHPSRNTGSPP
jgi:hypothetical protein